MNGEELEEYEAIITEILEQIELMWKSGDIKDTYAGNCLSIMAAAARRLVEQSG